MANFWFFCFVVAFVIAVKAMRDYARLSHEYKELFLKNLKDKKYND